MSGNAVHQVAVRNLTEFPCGLQYRLHLAILIQTLSPQLPLSSTCMSMKQV